MCAIFEGDMLSLPKKLPNGLLCKIHIPTPQHALPVGYFVSSDGTPGTSTMQPCTPLILFKDVSRTFLSCFTIKDEARLDLAFITIAIFCAISKMCAYI